MSTEPGTVAAITYRPSMETGEYGSGGRTQQVESYVDPWWRTSTWTR